MKKDRDEEGGIVVSPRFATRATITREIVGPQAEATQHPSVVCESGSERNTR